MRLTQVPSLNLNNVFPIELVYGEFFFYNLRVPLALTRCVLKHSGRTSILPLVYAHGPRNARSNALAQDDSASQSGIFFSRGKHLKIEYQILAAR